MAYDQNGLSTSSPPAQEALSFPPSLLGDVAQFIYSTAPYPNRTIALAGAIAFLSGITGRAFNTPTGSGLNQYMLVLAVTGQGKESIASGIGKLIAAVQASVPAIADFKGPGTLASAPGLIKWLDKRPCVFIIIGEFGLKFKTMASPKASPNDVALKAALLDLYGKSGTGAVFDPMAYSDTSKNTATIHSPALTIIGESVPDVFFEALDEGMIASGLLPRFMIFEHVGKRPYLNPSPALSPDPSLVQRLADLAAQCLQHAHNPTPTVVQLDPEASETFRRFEHWTTDQINSANSEVTRQLWNRAYLKALKLASVQAVGVNSYAPVIDLDSAMWATNLIAEQTNSILARFAKGDVGEVAGNEAKQLNEVIRVAVEYVNAPAGKFESYGCTEEMHRSGVFTQGYLSRRLIKLPTFKDKIGATNALKRAITSLLENDEVREVPAKQMQDQFGTKPRAFVISNPRRFLDTS